MSLVVFFPLVLLCCFLLANTAMPLMCLTEELIFEPLETNTEPQVSCNIANYYRSYWPVSSSMSVSDPVTPSLVFTSFFPLLTSECCPVPSLTNFFLVSPLPSDPGDCFQPTYCPAQISKNLRGLYLVQSTSLYFCWSGYHQCGLQASVDWSSPLSPWTCPPSTRNLAHCSRKWRCEGSQRIFIAVS